MACPRVLNPETDFGYLTNDLIIKWLNKLLIGHSQTTALGSRFFSFSPLGEKVGKRG